MKTILGLIALSLSIFGLDINTASVEELTKLKGIGAKKAQAIVEYRTANKCFKNLEELQNVKGIGEAFLEKNKEELSLSPCK